MAVLTDQDLLRKINKNGIVIYPFDENSLTGLGYDLNIGIIKPLTHIDKFKETDDGKFYVPVGGYCIVITKEYLWISGGYIGTLHARGSLAAKGLFLNPTNVDPNFKGQMIMSVFNASGVEIILERDQKFITLIFHEVKSPTKTLVGFEGTKNSIRVIQEMRNEIYVENATGTSNPKAFIEELNAYLINSNTTLQPIFEKKITNSSGLIPKQLRKEKWNNFLFSIRKFSNSTLNIFILSIIVIAICLKFIILKELISNNENNLDKVKVLASEVTIITGLLILIINNFKKKG